MGWHKENGRDVHDWRKAYSCEKCSRNQTELNNNLCEKCGCLGLKPIVARWVSKTTFWDVLKMSANHVLEPKIDPNTGAVVAYKENNQTVND